MYIYIYIYIYIYVCIYNIYIRVYDRDEKNRIKNLLKKKKEDLIDSESYLRHNNQDDDNKSSMKHIKNDSDLPVSKKRGGGGYKYPAFINENPLEWLYADNMHLYANNTAPKKVTTS
jgi:hypothetical protein